MSGVFEEKYFCAVNSGTGFISYYGELIKNAERIFIIKGGPGTGKSSFMRQIANRAKKCRKNVVYYYCSSDPESLDAIFIDGRTLFLDGTAPHTVETVLPGARDNIIDLGAFWDSAALIGQRNRIKRLSLDKSAAFSRAYRYLSAAREVTVVKDTIVYSALLEDKITAAAERALKDIRNGRSFSKNITVTNSFGMRGRVGFDTLRKLASTRISVSDVHGSAYLFLDRIVRVSEKKGLSVSVSLDPLMPEKADAVLIHSDGRLYFTGEGGEKNINMKRFLDPYELRRHASDLRRSESLGSELIDASLEQLSSCAEHHFALEKIYGEAMDFAAKEEFMDNFTSEMFD